MKQNFDPLTGAPLNDEQPIEPIQEQPTQEQLFTQQPTQEQPVTDQQTNEQPVTVQHIPEQPAAMDKSDFNYYPSYNDSPKTNANPYSHIPADPPKGGKKGLIFILIVLTIFALVVCAIIILVKSLKGTSSKDIVFNAMEKTFTTSSESTLSTYLDLETLNNLDSKDGVRILEYDFSITDFFNYDENFNDLSYLKNFGIKGNFITDLIKKQMSSISTITYEEKEYLDLNLYANNEIISFAIPQLLDGYFEMNTSNMEEDFKNSYIGKSYFDNFDIPTDFNLYEDENKNKEKVEIDVFSVILNKNIKSIKKAINVKKIDSINLDFDGKKERCKGYELTIPVKKVKTLLKELCDLSVVNTSNKNPYDELSVLINDDIVCNVYINKDGKMVKFTNSTKFYGGIVTLDIDFEWYGKDNSFDDCSGVISISGMGNYLSVQLESTTTIKDTLKSTQWYAEMTNSANDEVGIFDYLQTFDTKSGDYALYLDIYDTKQSVIALFFEGNFSDVIPGDQFTFTISDFCIDYLDSSFHIDLDGSIYNGPSTDSIDLPSGIKHNIYEIDEETMNELEDEMLDNLINSDFFKLLLNLSQDYYDDYEYDDYEYDDYDDYDDYEYDDYDDYDDYDNYEYDDYDDYDDTFWDDYDIDDSFDLFDL